MPKKRSGYRSPTGTVNPGSGQKSKKSHRKFTEMAYFRGKKECRKVQNYGNSGRITMYNAHNSRKNRAHMCIRHAFKQSRLQVKQEPKPASCALTVHANKHYHQQGLEPGTPNTQVKASTASPEACLTTILFCSIVLKIKVLCTNSSIRVMGR